MTNYEKYIKGKEGLYYNFDQIAIDALSNTPADCDHFQCYNCRFHSSYERDESCALAFARWASSQESETNYSEFFFTTDEKNFLKGVIDGIIFVKDSYDVRLYNEDDVATGNSYIKLSLEFKGVPNGTILNIREMRSNSIL